MPNTNIPSIAEILAGNPGWLDEAINRKQAADITGHTLCALDMLRSRGDGPPYSKIGRKVIYTRRDCFEWIMQNRRRPEAPACST